eukprot:1162710-Pyramimonas_sp.AAC.1
MVERGESASGAGQGGEGTDGETGVCAGRYGLEFFQEVVCVWLYTYLMKLDFVDDTMDSFIYDGFADYLDFIEY